MHHTQATKSNCTHPLTEQLKNQNHSGKVSSQDIFIFQTNATLWLCAPKTQHTERWSAQPGFEGLRHGEVTPVSQWCLHKLVLDTQVFKAIVELGVGHLNGQLLQDIRVLGVKVHAHLHQPIKWLGALHLVADQHASDVSLVDQLCDLSHVEHKHSSLVSAMHSFWYLYCNKICGINNNKKEREKSFDASLLTLQILVFLKHKVQQYCNYSFYSWHQTKS